MKEKHYIKIKGKDYEIRPTYGSFEKLFDKYDFKEMENESTKRQNELIIDAFWCFLVPKFLFFKPFLTKRGFKNSITMYELKDLAEMLPDLLTGEDRNLKN